MQQFHVEHHGSVCLVRPLTPAAREVMDAHLVTEGWQWWGSALAIEPRYLADALTHLYRCIDGEEVA
jgi:hypothetical protein